MSGANIVPCVFYFSFIHHVPLLVITHLEYLLCLVNVKGVVDMRVKNTKRYQNKRVECKDSERDVS